MLIKTKQEVMAYKQNKNPLRKDGASIDPISATFAAIKVGKLIGTLIKGAKVAKAGATAAKATKAVTTTAKAVKTAPKALQTIAQTGDKASKFKNVISKGKDVVSKVNTKVDDLATKASDFSKKVGLDRSPEEVKDIAKEKLLNSSSQLANRVEQTSPAPMNEKEEKREFNISKSSYSNPATISMGPSKSLKNISTTQDVGKKSAQQFGAEMRFNSLAQYGTSQEDRSDGFYPEKDKKQKEEESKPADKSFSSLEKSNLGKNFLNNFDAYANVGGIVFNVGDVARLGYAGVQKFIENKPKREKRRGERDIKKQIKKQPPLSIISKTKDINKETGPIIT